MRFASFNKLYAGTMNGRVYRFTKSGATWTRTRLDTMGGANTLGLAGAVTSIAIDPADATGDSIYMTFGGNGDFRHVWRFNGTQWQARSGPAAGAVDALLDVQHNAIVGDPANPATVYVGADIGVVAIDGRWRDVGDVLGGPAGCRVCSISTCTIRGGCCARRRTAAACGSTRSTARNLSGIELYVRDTQLDQGRITTVNGLADPTQQGETVRHWRGPDIKIDTPDAMGNYQFPITPGTTINFEQFTNQLTDDFQQRGDARDGDDHLARLRAGAQPRGDAGGRRPCDEPAGERVGRPAEPAGGLRDQRAERDANQHGRTGRRWGSRGCDNVRVGFPQIAAFDLPSSLLPPPANLAGNEHHCVLALVHHAFDQFTAAQTVTDLMSPRSGRPRTRT